MLKAEVLSKMDADWRAALAIGITPPLTKVGQ